MSGRADFFSSVELLSILIRGISGKKIPASIPLWVFLFLQDFGNLKVFLILLSFQK